jgi:hypothetical protein
MAKASIVVPLDPETARAYESATPEKKRKMQALVSLWLRDLAVSDYDSLEQLMDEVGSQAKARGMTPEILESIIKGE